MSSGACVRKRGKVSSLVWERRKLSLLKESPRCRVVDVVVVGGREASEVRGTSSTMLLCRRWRLSAEGREDKRALRGMTGELETQDARPFRSVGRHGFENDEVGGLGEPPSVSVSRVVADLSD